MPEDFWMDLKVELKRHCDREHLQSRKLGLLHYNLYQKIFKRFSQACRNLRCRR